MQFTADNVDINDSLLDGKDNFHATQVPGWQRGPDKTKNLASLRSADRTTLVIPEALCSNCKHLISWKTKVSRHLQNLLNRSGILFLQRLWRQAYFPETCASWDRLGVSWRSTGPCLYDPQFKPGGFVGLVSCRCSSVEWVSEWVFECCRVTSVVGMSVLVPW